MSIDINKYLNECGQGCPFCESENIEVIDTDFYVAGISQRVECAECKKQWNDLYSLTGVEEVDE